MAKVIRLDRKNPRIKKWEHFKYRFKIYLFRFSYLMNLACLLYFLNESGDLTNIIEAVNPILEAAKLKLSLLLGL